MTLPLLNTEGYKLINNANDELPALITYHPPEMNTVQILWDQLQQ